MDWLEDFKKDAAKMWDIEKRGEHYKLKVDFNELESLALKILLPKRSVDYFVLKEDGITKVFIQESNKKYDWRQNFMAYSVKTTISGLKRTYHAGFYLTAMTVFNDMRKRGLLDLALVEAYGYSHGAGALPIFGSLVRGRTDSALMGNRVIGFESPRCIFKPSKEVQGECFNDVWYKQGNDIVTTLPWWMKQLGQKRQVPARKLTGFKNVLKNVYDHDIYWTKEL